MNVLKILRNFLKILEKFWKILETQLNNPNKIRKIFSFFKIIEKSSEFLEPSLVSWFLHYKEHDFHSRKYRNMKNLNFPHLPGLISNFVYFLYEKALKSFKKNIRLYEKSRRVENLHDSSNFYF